MDFSQNSSLTSGNLVEVSIWGVRVEEGSVFNDGANESVVGVKQGFAGTASEAASKKVQKVGSISGFFQRLCDVGSVGAVVREGDAEIGDRF